MQNVSEWSDSQPRSICLKIFKVSLTILGRYAFKGLNLQVNFEIWIYKFYDTFVEYFV